MCVCADGLEIIPNFVMQQRNSVNPSLFRFLTRFLFPPTEMEFIFNLQKQGKRTPMLVQRNGRCSDSPAVLALTSAGLQSFQRRPARDGCRTTHEPPETLAKCGVLPPYDPRTFAPNGRHDFPLLAKRPAPERQLSVLPPPPL